MVDYLSATGSLRELHRNYSSGKWEVSLNLVHWYPVGYLNTILDVGRTKVRLSSCFFHTGQEEFPTHWYMLLKKPLFKLSGYYQFRSFLKGA